jgi:hypothetical protein
MERIEKEERVVSRLASRQEKASHRVIFRNTFCLDDDKSQARKGERFSNRSKLPPSF